MKQELLQPGKSKLYIEESEQVGSPFITCAEYSIAVYSSPCGYKGLKIDLQNAPLSTGNSSIALCLLTICKVLKELKIFYNLTILNSAIYVIPR